MFERFSEAAREVVVRAQEQARSADDDRIAPEHLLLAMLDDPAGTAGGVLRRAGLTHATALTQLERIRRDGPGADAAALEAIGIDLPAVRARLEQQLGVGAWERARRRVPRRRRLGAHLPFTTAAKDVLRLSLEEAVRLRHRRIGSEHLLLGLLRAGDPVTTELLVGGGLAPDDLRRLVLTEVTDAA